MLNPHIFKLTLHDPLDTDKLAKGIAQSLAGGEILALTGDLGSGKTTFTRALTRALDCRQLAKSPTFTIFNAYTNGRLEVLHGDFYRLTTECELDELGWQEMLAADEQRIIIIEWADKFPSRLPPDILRLDLSFGAGEDERELKLSATGPKAKRLLESIQL